MSTRNKSQLPKVKDIVKIDVTMDPYQLVCEHKEVVICSLEDHAKKKNCSKNPWCVFGLGENKEGIWSKAANPCSVLGADPSLHLRQMVGSKLSPPCGLKNLGATCYLNVLIQSLYHNPLVLDAVLNMHVSIVPDATMGEEEANMHKVVLALQEAFTHMMYSRDGVYNLANFVELLGLNSGQQQDPQEFNKLFFAKIETLHLPRLNNDRPALNDLITGQERYCTVCSSCKIDRGSDHDFHELDLSIAGVDTLDQAILNYLTGETLDGENQYECSQCGGRRDAERLTKINKLPIVLCIHLLRYTYDKKTLAKKKLQSDLTFPSLLTIQDEEYQLVAVLYHKGRSAHGGHYVCDALDWTSGEWWHCDDDRVVLTTNPADFAPVNSHAASNEIAHQEVMDLADDNEDGLYWVNKEGDTTKSTKDSEEGDGEEEEEEEWIEPSNGKGKDIIGGKRKSTATADKQGRGKPAKKAKESSSSAKDSKDNKDSKEKEKDGAEYDASTVKKGGGKNAHKNVNPKREAYMLSYVRRADFDQVVNTEDVMRIKPQTHLEQQILLTSTLFESHVAEHEARCDKIRKQVEERKRLIKKVLPDIVPKENEAYHLVPTEWLAAFMRGDPSTFPPVASSSSSSFSGCSSSSGAEVVHMVTDEDSGPVVSDSESLSGNHKNSSSSSSGHGVRHSSRHVNNVKSDKDHGHTSVEEATAQIKECDALCYLCEHGVGVRIDALDKFKLISQEAFKLIFNDKEKDVSKKQSINYQFTNDSIRCEACFSSNLGANQENSTLQESMTNILALVDASQTAGRDEGFLVPKSWLTSFRKYHEMLTTSLTTGKIKRSAVEIVALIHGTSFDATQLSDDVPVSNERDSNTGSRANSVNGDAEDAVHTPPSSSSSSKNKASRDVMDLSGGGGKPSVEVFDLRDDDPTTPAANNGTMDNWLSGANSSKSTSPLDYTITGALMCPHKNYLSSKKSQAVSVAAWEALCLLYVNAVAVPAGEPSCAVCKKAADSRGESKEKAKQVRRLEMEVPALLALSKMKQTYDRAFDSPETYLVSLDDLDPQKDVQGLKFNLVDGAWMSSWRWYLKNSEGKRPNPADLVYRSKLRCKHNNALVPVEFRGIPDGICPSFGDLSSLLVTSLDVRRDDGCPSAELISNAQWKLLMAFEPEKEYHRLVGTIEDGDEDDSPLVNAEGISLDWCEDQGGWRFDPEVCTECLEALREKTELSKIQYDSECVQVRIYRDHEKFTQAITAEAVTSGESSGNSRPSRSCKRSSAYKQATVTLSSSDDISLVKLKLMQVVEDGDLSPAGMRLYSEKGFEFDTHNKSLGFYHFKACDLLLVLYDEAAEGGDDDLMFAYHETDGARGRESGFGGSVLTGGGGKRAASKKDKDKLQPVVVDLDETQIEGQHQFDEDFEDPAGFGREEGLEEVGADEVHPMERQDEGVMVMDNDDDDDDQFLVGGRPRAASLCVDEMKLITPSIARHQPHKWNQPVPAAARSPTLTREEQEEADLKQAMALSLMDEEDQYETFDGSGMV